MVPRRSRRMLMLQRGEAVPAAWMPTRGRKLGLCWQPGNEMADAASGSAKIVSSNPSCMSKTLRLSCSRPKVVLPFRGAMPRLLRPFRPLREGQVMRSWIFPSSQACRRNPIDCLTTHPSPSPYLTWKYALVLAGAGCGALLQNCKRRPAGCEGDAWWSDPAQSSDTSALWQRAWNPDWDGRAPPSLPTAAQVKTTGQIRHLLFIRHGQYNLDDDDHGSLV